ncbi:MAG: bifunctional (p)ppGpp synthetase/guanosine-3',5'-bis(diphosphate) 3'-pyrophosphohydrolase [Alistipes sp.]|nr:bifunctional (p)ppGpp synthetase/guanosine-3',5'-bis(diphosphate) 3'-pyrophosphohydrolase [Candidatus Alistipes equi]
MALNSYQKIADALIKRLSKRFSEEEINRIRAAYELAEKAHANQKRKTGEPYIVHPIAVASIAGEDLELDANCVIAAFLHDVVEDTPYTIDDITAIFGEDVAKLVNVVTKQKERKQDSSKQVANYQQILSSVHYDIRALMVKLTDRLHNMRTLSSMHAAKQMKIAGETDYFYAPLANRLGLYHMKAELENLSFKFRCPREFEFLSEQLNLLKTQQSSSENRFMDSIRDIMRKAGMPVRIELRYRTEFSIWRKMHANNCDFSHVEGKHYIRIIYKPTKKFSEKDRALWIYSLLTDVFRELPGSVVNYIDSPKENGYQSFHVKLLSNDAEWEEVHISSERMVRASRLGCMAEQTECNIQKWLEKFQHVLQELANKDDKEYMESVTSSFYNDDILVFTPSGKGVILPKNATVLDFAYEISPWLGNHAKYARINGRLCSIRTILHRGDKIEIGADENITPRKEWLNYVSTFNAKHNIRNSLVKLPTLPFHRCEICHPIPGDEVIGIHSKIGELIIHRRDCSLAIKDASEYGDRLHDVEFNIDNKFLYPVRLQITAVDRYHLLVDLLNCISDQEHLAMESLNTQTSDCISVITVDFSVHSLDELIHVRSSIERIEGVDEVKRVNIE